MKKLFFFAVVAIAMAGYGINAGVAHAQTADSASLQQQLDVAKATLINLEMQKGLVPQGDDQISAGTSAGAGISQPSGSGLTADETAYFESALSSLATSLGQLNATIVANPNMNASQEAAIAATLGGMRNTLATMANQIAQDENGTPVAMAAPSANAGSGNAAQGSSAGAGTPSRPTTAAAASTGQLSTNVVQATAQASSLWSFTKANWPVIVIIMLVIAILAILFWPEDEKKKAPMQMTTTTSSTKVTTTVAPGASSSASVSSAPAAGAGAPQGAVSGMQSQKIETKETKVIVVKAPVDMKQPA